VFESPILQNNPNASESCSKYLIMTSYVAGCDLGQPVRKSIAVHSCLLQPIAVTQGLSFPLSGSLGGNSPSM
jgi:hypothetical protein